MYIFNSVSTSPQNTISTSLDEGFKVSFKLNLIIKIYADMETGVENILNQGI